MLKCPDNLCRAARRLNKLEAEQESAALRVLELIKMGRSVAGPWERFVTPIAESQGLEVSDFWAMVESALTLVESGNASPQ